MTNTEIVKGMYEAFNRGDVAAVINSLDDNVEWTVPGPNSIPYARHYTGKNDAAGFFKKLAETSNIDPITVERYVEQGDVVVAVGSYTGQSKPMQKRFQTGFAMVFTLRGGKVTRFQEYMDTAAIAASYASGSQAAQGRP